MFGVVYCSAFSLIRSPPTRSIGGPVIQVSLPSAAQRTVALALWLSSPSIIHSKPSETNVGGSTMSSPEIVASSAEATAGTIASNQNASTSLLTITAPV